VKLNDIVIENLFFISFRFKFVKKLMSYVVYGYKGY